MGLLSRLFSRATQATVTILNWMGVSIGDTSAVTDASYPAAYSTNPWVNAAVRVIAEAAASAPLRIQQKRGDKWEDVPEENELATLFRWVNETSDQYTLIEDTISWLMLDGNAYWLPLRTRGDKGQVAGLQVFPSTKVKPKDLGNGKWAYELSLPESKTKIVDPKDIVHFRLFSPDHEIMGLSPIKPLETVINGFGQALSWNYRWYKGGGIPPAVVSCETTITQKQAEDMGADWDRTRGGAKGAGRPFFHGKGMRFEKIGSDPDSNTALSYPNSMRDTIVGALGTPPTTVGVMDKANYANRREERKALWQDRVIPLLQRIEMGIAGQLLPMLDLQGKVQVFFNLADVEALKTDRLEVADKATSLITTGVLTVNEVRSDYFDLPPVPWGDSYWGTFSQIELGNVTQGVIPPPEPATSDATSGAVDASSQEDEASKSKRLVIVRIDGTWETVRRADGKTSKRMTAQAKRKYGLAYRTEWLKREQAIAQATGEWFTGLGEECKRLIDEKVPARSHVRIIPGEQLVPSVEDAHTAIVKKLTPHITDAFEGGGKAVAGAMGIAFNLDSKAVQALIKARTVKLKTASETATTKLRTSLAEGLANNEGLRDLKLRVDSLVSTYNDGHAFNIARTETGSAMNEGSFNEWKAADANFKEWDAILDDKTRDEHAEMAGRDPIPIDDEFELPDGNTCMFPGSTGDPAADCNCRCTSTGVWQ